MPPTTSTIPPAVSPPPPAGPEPAPLPPRRSDRLLAWCDHRRGWILLAVLLLYALAFNVHWRPHSDSALHLTIAQHMVEGHGFVHPTGHEVRVNPGLAYLMTVPMFIVGTEPEQLWLANAMMMLLGLATLTVVYRLFIVTHDRPTAVLLTAMLATSLTFLGHTLQLITDIPFLLGGLLFLLGWAHWSQRGRLGWQPLALMLVGAAIMVLFRTVAITFLGAAALALVGHAWRERRSPHVWGSCLALVGIVVVGLALAVLTSSGLSGVSADDDAARPVAVEQPADDWTLIQQRLTRLDTLVTEHVPPNLHAMFADNLAVAAFGVNFGPIANGVLAVALLAGALTLVRRQPLWALLILAFVTQMLLFLSERRYFLAILPLLLAGWWHAALWLELRLPRKWGAYALTLMVALWATPNMVRSINQVIEQRQRPYLVRLSDGKYDDFYRLAAKLRSRVEPSAVVVGDVDVDHAVLSFWARRTTVNSREFESLEAFDAPVYVIEPTGERLRALIESRDWTLSEPLFHFEPHMRGLEAWSLRKIDDDASGDELP